MEELPNLRIILKAVFGPSESSDNHITPGLRSGKYDLQSDENFSPCCHISVETLVWELYASANRKLSVYYLPPPRCSPLSHKNTRWRSMKLYLDDLMDAARV